MTISMTVAGEWVIQADAAMKAAIRLHGEAIADLAAMVSGDAPIPRQALLDVAERLCVARNRLIQATLPF